METKNLDLMVRAVSKGSDRTATFVASTGAIDAHGEVIDQSSWDLTHFKANPVILAFHDSRALPIGKATDVGVKGGKLEVTIAFATHAKAEEIFTLVKDDVLRAVSVGFLPGEAHAEVRGGESVIVWKRCQLKEISIVAVGANHEALRKALGDAPAARVRGETTDLLAEFQRECGLTTPRHEIDEIYERDISPDTSPGAVIARRIEALQPTRAPEVRHATDDLIAECFGMEVAS